MSNKFLKNNNVDDEIKDQYKKYRNQKGTKEHTFVANKTTIKERGDL